MEYIVCARCGAHIHDGNGCVCRYVEQIELELRSSRKPVKARYELDSYGKEAPNHDAW